VNLDLEDILGSVLGRIVLLFGYLATAVWVGSAIGAVARMVGDIDVAAGIYFPDFLDLWRAPYLLVNIWLVPNFAILAVAITYLMVTGNLGYAAWGIIVGIEALFAMTGYASDFYFSGNMLAAWISCLLLLAMLETGLWLIHKMQVNRWAQDLAMLRAENAMRRGEGDSPDPSGDPPGSGAPALKSDPDDAL